MGRLTYAAQVGDVSNVKELLDIGVPIDSVDVLGYTALRRAAINNRTNVTIVLCNREADVNKRSGDQSTALHEAALNNSTDVIEVLLKYGASTNIENRYGDTPIDVARRENHDAAVRLLVRH